MLRVNRTLGAVEPERNHPRFQTHNLEPNTAIQSRCLAAPPQGPVPKTDLTAEKLLCQVFWAKKNLWFNVNLYYYGPKAIKNPHINLVWYAYAHTAAALQRVSIVLTVVKIVNSPIII